jgi:hypothetical protein
VLVDFPSITSLRSKKVLGQVLEQTPDLLRYAHDLAALHYAAYFTLFVFGR